MTVQGLGSVSLSASDGTPLPRAWFESRQPRVPGDRTNYFSSAGFRDESVRTGAPWRDDAVLGPYPFPTITVRGASAACVPNE